MKKYHNKTKIDHELLRARKTEVVIMRLHCKAGSFTDQKKERSKRACRSFKYAREDVC
jgi:hypothetical protein